MLKSSEIYSKTLFEDYLVVMDGDGVKRFSDLFGLWHCMCRLLGPSPRKKMLMELDSDRLHVTGADGDVIGNL